MKLFGKTVFAVLVLTVCAAAAGFATPEFAERTGKTCAFCHDGANGGPLNPVGVAFVRNGYAYPIPEPILEKSIALSGTFHKTLRLILGIIHLITAAILVGTIFYIHIIVKPHELKGGVPMGEKRLGLTCMSILAATGVYLTWYRIDSMASFFESRFGVLLFIKILLFMIMVALGVLAVTIISRKMRERLKQGAAGPGPSDHAPGRSRAECLDSEGLDEEGRDEESLEPDFDIKNLPKYDGKEGRPAYVLYNNFLLRISDR